MGATPLAPGLYILDGAVNTGVLVHGDKALLIDCCDTVTPERLAALGVRTVDLILCTQHRRPNVAGAYPFVQAGARLLVPAEERPLFDDTDSYWNDPKNRWHIYHHQPGPQVLARPIQVSGTVGEGEVIEWEGHSIRVLDTPGATDGSVSFLLPIDERAICFSGDTLYGPGQLWDLCSLQKGHGGSHDYHGFIGNKFKLIPSLQKLLSCGADRLVPSHGDLIGDPQAAIELVLDRLDALWRNYTSISTINYCYPHLFDDTKDDPGRMEPAARHEPPDFVRRVVGTCYALVSDTGGALIFDCGGEVVADTLQEWLDQGAISSVEACWVTHYHDDHVNGLYKLDETFGCPIMTDEHLAEIVEHPLRFFLPCISPNPAPVARQTQNGESWQWHEFTLTAFHFPGQSFYHSGLFVEGHGKTIFFAGDSGSPNGLDDYCCPNRNFLGPGKGFRRCIELWRELQPDYILNEHQPFVFSFTDEQLAYMEETLVQRERLLAEMLPWEHPNFGTDENWVRTYPYEQAAEPGDLIPIDVQFTNHGPTPACAAVEPVLPDGWTHDAERSTKRIDVPANTDGSVDTYCANPDRAATVWIRVAADAEPGRYIIPFRVTWSGRYLGQFRHAIATVG